MRRKAINFIDMENKSFGRLLVLKLAYIGNDNRAYWSCKCVCGSIKNISGKELRKGSIRSCGCLKLERIKESTSGENHYRWNEKVGYKGIHTWLSKEYGRANKCENTACPSSSRRFEWALKRGCIYERKRENFIQLCKSCHANYDYTETWRKNISISGKKIVRIRDKWGRFSHMV